MTSPDLTNNYSHESIPDDQCVNGIRIALIIVGIAITLPAFLLGAKIIVALGFVRGAMAIVIGELIITAIALMTMTVGATSRLSTYLIVQFSFGPTAGRWVSLLLSTTLFGWFGVTLMLFAQACRQTFIDVFSLELPVEVFIITGSLLMVATTIFGFRAIERLARLAVPLLAALLLFGVYRALADTPLTELLATPAVADPILSSFGLAVSAVVGGLMVGATIVPDLARFSRHRKDAVIGALLSYGSGCILVLVFAGLPAIVVGTTDLVAVMISIGLGLPALIIMIFATWTTNINNLYSSSLGLAQSFPKTPDWVITLAAGTLGTVLALVGIFEHFVTFLLLLSACIPPIAGIYLVDFFLISKQNYAVQALHRLKRIKFTAICAWVLAIAVAVLTTRGLFSLTGIPACDSLLIAAVCYFVMEKYLPK